MVVPALGDDPSLLTSGSGGVLTSAVIPSTADSVIATPDVNLKVPGISMDSIEKSASNSLNRTGIKDGIPHDPQGSVTEANVLGTDIFLEEDDKMRGRESSVSSADGIITSGGGGSTVGRFKKYSFNPDDSDFPPHLSEYCDRNVIAILNRCDPERGLRCYSCGYDNSVNLNQQGHATGNFGRSDANPSAAVSGGGYPGFRNSIGYDEDETYCWNNYSNNGGTTGVGNNPDFSNHQGHGIGSKNMQHQHCPQPHHHQHGQAGLNYYDGSVGYYHNNMSESEMAMAISRRRYNSDGTNSDLDSGNAMDDEEVFTFDARLLSEAFLSSGRIDHTIQLMAYHPDYLDIFLKTHHFLMRGDGPLPYNHRNYIAIMAAARYQCSYLMELQKREFLYQGGDPKWLRGLDSAPAKLMALYNINKIMAHRPWVLKKEDFLHLTKKAGWSLSEVVQAVVILAHFHSLSSFIHGCGITPEIDFDKGHSYMDPGDFNTFKSVSEALGGNPEGSTAIENACAAVLSNNNQSSPPSSPSVSFALDQPTSYFGSSSGGGGTRASGNSGPVGASPNSPDLTKEQKQTKSILKKTEVVSSTTTANSTNLNISSATTTTSSANNLLKSTTLHSNSLPSTGSLLGPFKKGLGSSVSEVEIIMATMKNLSETSPIEDPEERKKRFENVASSDDSHEKENQLSHGLTKGSSAIPPEISPFVCDPEFIYEDFAKRGQVSELHTFRIQDYSWEEHGFSLVNRLYTEVGVYLDEKFKVTQGMTYYTMGGRAHVDTTKFRTAVWNYIQCLYGIRHDDYDYGEVNQLLERPLKAYVKTVCCYPERVTKADYDNVMREFKHSEKVHVNLMIMEAKIQAELLYALRTIMKFMI